MVSAHPKIVLHVLSIAKFHGRPHRGHVKYSFRDAITLARRLYGASFGTPHTHHPDGPAARRRLLSGKTDTMQLLLSPKIANIATPTTWIANTAHGLAIDQNADQIHCFGGGSLLLWLLLRAQHARSHRSVKSGARPLAIRTKHESSQCVATARYANSALSRAHAASRPPWPQLAPPTCRRSSSMVTCCCQPQCRPRPPSKAQTRTCRR